MAFIASDLRSGRSGGGVGQSEVLDKRNDRIRWDELRSIRHDNHEDYFNGLWRRQARRLSRLAGFDGHGAAQVFVCEERWLSGRIGAIPPFGVPAIGRLDSQTQPQGKKIMNKERIITMPPPAAGNGVQIRPVLNREGFAAAVVVLAPGQTIAPERSTDDKVLFVIEGDVTVDLDELTYLLGREEALHIAKDKTISVANHGSVTARFFKVEVASHVEAPNPLLVFPV